MADEITRVFLEEEYGYRYWDWFFPGTKEELAEYWQTLGEMWDYCSDATKLKGEVVRIKDWEYEIEEWKLDWDTTWSALPQAHIHCNDDSYLVVDGVGYRHAAFEDTEPTT